MATIVNNPGNDSSGAAGWVIAIAIVVIVALALLFGIPALQNSGTSVTVPDQIDVNVGGAGAQ